MNFFLEKNYFIYEMKNTSTRKIKDGERSVKLIGKVAGKD